MKNLLKFYAAFFMLSGSWCYGEEMANATESKPKEKKVEYRTHDDRGMGNNDDAPYNKRHTIGLLLGPGGVQNGQPNPLGLPPGLTDIEVTYVHPSGIEGNFSIVPGITGGVRYRVGPALYGSIGAGLIFSAQGLGPGIYSAIGINVLRYNRITYDVEIKQAIGVVSGPGGAYVTSPYAFRMGAGYHW